MQDALHAVIVGCLDLDVFSLSDFGRLYCSSKALQLACTSSLTADRGRAARILLLKAARQAAEPEHYWPSDLPGPAKMEQQQQQVSWLLRVALSSSDSLQPATEQLLHVPSTPQWLADMLLAAGVRPSYLQLLAAARDHVLGLDAWLRALDNLGSSDIPAAAFDLLAGPDSSTNVSGGGVKMRLYSL